MKERDTLVVCTQFGASDNPISLPLQPCDFSRQVIHEKRHVMQARTSLFKMTGDGAVWRCGFKQLHFGISCLKEGGEDPFA